MNLLYSVANTLIYLHIFAKMLAPFALGVAGFAAVTQENTRRLWLTICWFSLILFAVVFGGYNLIIQPQIPQAIAFPSSDLIISFLFVCMGAAVWFVYLRSVHPFLNAESQKFVKRSAVERNKKTDVRSIDQFLPAVPSLFDPSKFFKKGAFFLGLGEGDKPIYFEQETLPHTQILGTSGAGKGVLLGAIAAQCLRAGEAVFWLDPKDDEWAPFVLQKSALDANKPFVLIDLRPSAPPQINLFENSTPGQIEELFLAGFSLTEKGTESDFYSIEDRWAASLVAADYKDGDTPASLLARHQELADTAKKFFGLLREMAQIQSVNAKSGFDLRNVVRDGGAVYVIGSMRNAKVIRLQRMLNVKIIQLCEERDRTNGKPRAVCAILDEVKYHLSKPFLEGLGAARDKGLHIVLAHQSLADLKDCPADLNAEAVVGAVMENCALKIVYRVEDPLTAEWMARKSGRIQVDDEVRRVTKNAGFAEIVNPERQMRQAERFLIDENLILNLRKSQAVVFGTGIAKFISTSPIQVKKTADTLKIQGVAGDKIITAADLI